MLPENAEDPEVSSSTSASDLSHAVAEESKYASTGQ
jgi:hypothetical protein